MKKIFLFLALVVLTGALSIPAFAVTKETKNGVDPPHYLREWAEPKKNINGDELEKWKVIRRMFLVTDKCSFSENSTIINGSETTVIKIEGKETKIVFDNYIREGGKISYYSPCGKTELTLAEFEAVKKDIIATYKEAVEIAWEKHKEMTPELLKRAAEKSGMPLEKFKARLKEKIGDTDITYGEIAQINEITKKDFVIKEFHLGIIEAWGLTWLNSGKVLYSPQARLYDYLNDIPLVVIHELIHANPKLQRMPVAWYFDAELAASFLQALTDKTDVVTFLRHGYLDDIRWAARVFFSFDSEKVNKEIVKFKWSKNQAEIDEAAFRKYEAQIKIIRTELRKEIFENILPEFYSDLLLWTTANARYADENAYFKIWMSVHYDPTLLGGHQKTMRWADQNAEKIKEAAEEAWRETANESKEESEDDEFLKKIANIAKMLGLSQGQIDALAEKYGKMNISGIRNLFWELFDFEILPRDDKSGGGKK